MDKIVVEFTGAELKALQQLIHTAVQARGLEVAAVAVMLNQKIIKSLEEQKSEG